MKSFLKRTRDRFMMLMERRDCNLVLVLEVEPEDLRDSEDTILVVVLDLLLGMQRTYSKTSSEEKTHSLHSLMNKMTSSSPSAEAFSVDKENKPEQVAKIRNKVEELMISSAEASMTILASDKVLVEALEAASEEVASVEEASEETFSTVDSVA